LPRVEELEELVNKFEDRIKLVGLINEKRFAELELKIGEMNQKLNEVTTDFPKLKERAAEIEDLLNIVNLGLVEYKDNFEKVDSGFSEFKKIPETLESVRTNLESKMRELNESVSNLTANVNVLKNLKEDITKSTEETVSSKVKTVEEGIEHNKVEIEHVKRDLDGFSVALRSFERTIELTNLDDIIRRFDSLDRKIINVETELEKFRGLVPDISITIGDVEILKKKLREMSSSVIDTLSRMNEFEMNINKKITLFEDLAKKAESADEDVKTQISKLEEAKISVEKIYSDVNERVSSLTTVNEEINRLKAGIEDTKSDVGKFYSDLNEKISGITNVNEDVNKLKFDVEELKTSRPNLNEMIANVKNEIIAGVKSQLPADYGMRISKLEEQINNVPSLNFDEKLASLREKVEDIEKSVMNINKSMFSFPKIDVGPRALKVENVIKEIPKNVADEIISLKNILSRISSENNDLKRVIRDIRLNQMDAITSDIFVSVTARISTIEKKLSEVEEEISKMRTNH
jgi:chromosome segregation ATPase